MGIYVHVIFDVSYALLSAVIVVESVVLRQVLGETARLKRLYTRPARPMGDLGIPSGMPAPEFSASLLNRGSILSNGDLKGNASILVFVRPHEASLPGYEQLSTAMHALWHKVSGHLYVVCAGTEEDCGQFASGQRFHGCKEGELLMLLDKDASIARSFAIESTPMAVELDEDVLVSRYGVPNVGLLEPRRG